MSVLVKGMKMPDNCEQCAFQSDVGFCLAMPKNFCGYTETDKRSDFCPLVALPDKHGRLVDADALEPDADYDDGDYWAYSVAQVCNAPTIVEAEDEP